MQTSAHGGTSGGGIVKSWMDAPSTGGCGINVLQLTSTQWQEANEAFRASRGDLMTKLEIC